MHLKNARESRGSWAAWCSVQLAREEEDIRTSTGQKGGTSSVCKGADDTIASLLASCFTEVEDIAVIDIPRVPRDSRQKQRKRTTSRAKATKNE